MLSSLFDANIFCGNYPFRPLPGGTPQSLIRFLRESEIPRCIATPFESIFYRQPWEGLQPWLDAPELAIPGTPDVKFWLVVNPLMPRWQDDVAKAAEHPGVAGLRLWPRYHGYTLDEPAVDEVTELAAKYGLPVNLSARLLDDRLHPKPLWCGEPLAMDDVTALIQRSPGTRWLLSMFAMAELKQCAEAVAAHPAAYVDIGCAKPFEFWEDHIRATAPAHRAVLGTGAPLYYHLGTRISLQRTNFSDDEKTGFFYANLETALNV